MLKKVKKNQDQVKDPKTGKFTVTPDSPLVRWNRPGVAGFAQWFKDTQPRVLSSRNQYEKIKLTKSQIENLKEILKVDESGKLVHSMSLLVWPRRHGKSTLFALIILWLFTSKKNLTIQLLGNSEQHTRRTQQGTLKKIIRNTPALARAIPEDSILRDEIHNHKMGNVIQMAGLNLGPAFGDKLNVLWVSDLHACDNLEPFAAYQASLLDSEESCVFLDSNCDSTDGPVHALQRQAEEDESIFCSHIEYPDLETYLAEGGAPPWINRAKAKRLQSTLLPPDFARDILGKRVDATNQLFSSEVISRCKSDYAIPVQDLKKLVAGRAYKIGAGLDRSKSLFGNDNTVWSVVAKVASPAHGEPEFFLLNQEIITPNTSRLIKKAILRDHERFHLDNVTLENYEVSDLAGWVSEQRIPFELLSPHTSNQNLSFVELFRIFQEQRFHYPANLEGLTKELSTFVYTQRTGGGGQYTFGHSSTKFKDDRVYSLNWAVHSLRDAVMNAYVLGSFACKNKSPNRQHCFLMDGSLTLHCSESCQAFQQVREMFVQYKQQVFESEMDLPEFYSVKVKREGARIYQAA
jgi:hypothetical protein